MSLGVIFLSEVVGTAMLILLGCGVVANTALAKTKGNGTGFLFVNWGWGLAVFAGVLVSYKSGGHLNPAVTLGVASSGAENFVPGIAVGVTSILTYIAAQFVGAFIGATLCWLAYKDHFDKEQDAATKLGVFSTGPAIRNPLMNVVTEAIGTFVLVFVVLAAGHWGDSATKTPATSAPASCTPSCPSRARAAPTGATRGFRLSAPSSAASSPASSPACSCPPDPSRSTPKTPFTRK